MKQTKAKRSIFLTVMITLLTLGTLAAAPTEIYHWHQYYPWWWTLNAAGVYSISLVSLYGVYQLRKWGFWLSVGSTLAAPVYLRPNDPTLQTVHGAIIYIVITGGLIGLYWYAVLRNWRNFV
jgi:hypothetical protein